MNFMFFVLFMHLLGEHLQLFSECVLSTLSKLLFMQFIMHFPPKTVMKNLTSQSRFYLIILSDGMSACMTTDHEVAGSIPGTSTNFKCGLGLELGPPSLVRTIG